MALTATRMEFRLSLSDAQRGVDVTQGLVVARHPSETQEHVVLRVLAWCALYDETLEMGPGLSDRETPDLVAKDARGDVTMWVACGRVPWERLRKALSQSSGARVCAFFSELRRAEELDAEIAALPRPPKELARVESWLVDDALVASLAKDARRHTWSVTLVEGHAYVDADGTSFDGALGRRALA